MTADKITQERVATLAIVMAVATNRIDDIRKEIASSEILPADAAKEINQIMEDLAKCAG